MSFVKKGALLQELDVIAVDYEQSVKLRAWFERNFTEAHVVESIDNRFRDNFPPARVDKLLADRLGRHLFGMSEVQIERMDGPGGEDVYHARLVVAK